MKEIDNYMENVEGYTLSEKEKTKILKHCSKFKIDADICAWYDDFNDFCEDWLHIHKTKKEIKQRYKYGREIGEFILLSNNRIIRISL